MVLIQNAIVPILTGIIFCLCSLGIGAALVGSIFQRKRPGLVESFSIGTIFVALVTMLLGTAGLIGAVHRPFILLVFLVISLIGWIKFTPRVKLDIKALANITGVSLGLLIVVGVILRMINMPLYPPNSWDECSCHIPNVLHMIETGYDLYYPVVLYSNTPRNADMLFFWAAAWSPESSVHFTSFAAFIFILIATARIGSVVFSPKVGLLGALLLGTFGHIQWHAVTAYHDIWVVLYITAAIMVLVENHKNHDPKNLVIAGIILGGAAGTKYTALPALLALPIAYFLLHKFDKTVTSPVQVKHFWFAALAALLVASPWYIRNMIWFVSPFFPVFSSVFPVENGLYGSYAAENQVDAREMLYPFTMQAAIESGRLARVILKQSITLGGIYIGIIFWRRSLFLRFAALFGVLVVSFWLIGMGGIFYSRYYLFLAPITAIVLAYLLSEVYTRLRGLNSNRSVTVALWVLLLLYVGLIGNMIDEGPAPLHPDAQDIWLSGKIKSYDLITTANEVISTDEIAVNIMAEDARLYADFTLLGGTDVGRASHPALAEHTDSARELAEFLFVTYNASWLIVNEKRLDSDEEHPLVRVELPLDDPEFSEFFVEEARMEDGVVYRIEVSLILNGES